MARAFKNMQSRAARGRRSSVNDSFSARLHQLEVFAFELASSVGREPQAYDEDMQEACAEYVQFITEVNRAK